MDKQRDDRARARRSGPSLDGPDYFSLVIEWSDPERADPPEPAPRPRAAAERPVARPEPPPRSRPATAWDVVDEASYESFPASDPPAWGSSHAAPSAESAASNEPFLQSTDKRRFAALGRLLFAFAAVGAVLQWIRHLRRRNSLRV